ncbi:MAG: YkuS family protein [Firmicutes bacterium]|nr:YkuS family protein [Bacillota bacterium]
MIVLIERGLEIIKRDLEKRGYKIFFIDENKSADVIVYNGEKFPSLALIDDTIHPMLTKKHKNSKGALLINGKKKNADEIIEIMKKGSYSPLFE